MTDFMIGNNIILKTQHGFLPTGSTNTNLLMCLNDCSRDLNECDSCALPGLSKDIRLGPCCTSAIQARIRWHKA